MENNKLIWEEKNIWFFFSFNKKNKKTSKEKLSGFFAPLSRSFYFESPPLYHRKQWVLLFNNFNDGFSSIHRANERVRVKVGKREKEREIDILFTQVHKLFVVLFSF